MYRILTYPIFIAKSVIFPKKDNIWVFGHYNGYSENTKYFFEYASSINEYDCYWLANNCIELNTVKSKGYKAVLKNSIKGYSYSSEAYLTFICTGFSDVNRLLSLNSNVIHFWHGTPIKKVFFDVDVKKSLRSHVNRSISKFLVSRIKYYYASSSFEQNIVCKAARINTNISTVLGSPRFDAIRNPVLNKHFSEYKSKYNKIILFAPTWRENGNWDSGYTLTESNMAALEIFLEKENAMILIKPHPKSDPNEMKEWGLNCSDRIVYAQDLYINDINNIYKFIDVLITDVSSVIFDFLIYDKPVMFFMPDVVNYINNERGVYDYFEKNLLKFSIINWDDLINQLKNPKINNDLFGIISTETKELKNTNNHIYKHLIEKFYK